MNFIKIHFEKIVIGILLIIVLQQCSTSHKVKVLEKDQRALTQQIDSVYKKDLQNLIEIEGLKISKRTLYDWNSVVRTAVRPDDRMISYDKEIEKLQKK